jgi:hypothetical protein
MFQNQLHCTICGRTAQFSGPQAMPKAPSSSREDDTIAKVAARGETFARSSPIAHATTSPQRYGPPCPNKLGTSAVCRCPIWRAWSRIKSDRVRPSLSGEAARELVEAQLERGRLRKMAWRSSQFHGQETHTRAEGLVGSPWTKQQCGQTGVQTELTGFDVIAVRIRTL